MDPLQNNLIHFNGQDAISDSGMAAGRGGGQCRVEEKPGGGKEMLG